MVIQLRKVMKFLIGTVVLAAVVTVLCLVQSERKNPFALGGSVHSGRMPGQEQVMSVYGTASGTAGANRNSEADERFQRPSKEPALKLKYSFQELVNQPGEPPEIQMHFKTPEDVVHAYYAILKEASNMKGYHGGCGTIGMAKTPHPYAYSLLSAETKRRMPPDKFVDSFAGIGHMTLLKFYPAYRPLDTPDNIRYFMVETEVITGPPYKGKEDRPQPSFFAYYYGIVTSEFSPAEGWKIKAVDYIPEDFLCAPYHLWHWDAEALVQTVYKEWYQLIDHIEKVEKGNSMIQVYAAGGPNQYRFDFVQLTNGVDILLHEYMQKDGQWKEVDLLKEEHRFYKFSIPSTMLKAK